MELKVSKKHRHLQITKTTPLEWDNQDKVYKVTFSKDLQDQYGQKLEKDVVWEVKLKPTTFQSSLRTLASTSDPSAEAQDIIIYDPNLVAARNMPPSFCVLTKNYKELQVALYKLNPHTDLKKWYTTKTGLPKKEGMQRSNIVFLFFANTTIR